MNREQIDERLALPWDHLDAPLRREREALETAQKLGQELDEARAERDEAEKRYVEQLERADAAVGDRDHRVAALQAENRLLQDMVAEYMLSLKEWSNEYWESRLEVAPLTAAEIERVQRMEKVAEAAKALRSEHRADFMDDGARQDRLYELFQLLDEHDEAAVLGEGES